MTRDPEITTAPDESVHIHLPPAPALLDFVDFNNDREQREAGMHAWREALSTWERVCRWRKHARLAVGGELADDPELFAVRMVGPLPGASVKIHAIKVLRAEYGPKLLGLKQAKELIEAGAPTYLARRWPLERANRLAEDLEALGCPVEVVPNYPEEPTP